MPKRKQKHSFVLDSDSDNSGSDDRILVNAKIRKIIESNIWDNSSDETSHQSHPFIPRSPRSLEEEDGGSGSYHPPIADLNSPSSSIELVEESIRIQERPINYCFLTDLASPQSKYVTNFQENKQELTRCLYEFYNQTVFDDELPADMKITWNKRLRTTAGLTRMCEEDGNPYAIIELSAKICDSAARLRDTLIHEMCHAACWVIDGDRYAGHGWRWLFFCQTAAQAHPDLPPITAYHSYEIHYPVVYECSGCQFRVGRWKASLDTQRYVCGHCKGDMILRKDPAMIPAQR
ncbi:germ cell nuclear acidic protein-like [Engystomops pustulosus]|uniref:germ cell nuclear acidic protein-like n=1 Tax=Engystomops pustulosus TaxID=76066 RepID=UPI003AFA0312